MKAKLLVFCDVILMVVKQAKTKGKRWQGKEARGVLAPSPINPQVSLFNTIPTVNSYDTPIQGYITQHSHNTHTVIISWSSGSYQGSTT